MILQGSQFHHGGMTKWKTQRMNCLRGLNRKEAAENITLTRSEQNWIDALDGATMHQGKQKKLGKDRESSRERDTNGISRG